MLYKDGEAHTLSDLEPGGADEDQIYEWFCQMCDALAYVHAQGIVHRDIKLNNILIAPDHHLVLSDFGISRVCDNGLRQALNASRTLSSATGGKLVVGTQGYMAPEVTRGETATPAADVYALGVVFFKLLTGVWYDPDLEPVANQATTGSTDARKLLAGFERPWKDVLPRMLATDPSQRPTDLKALPNELRLAAAHPAEEPQPALTRPNRRKMRRGILVALVAERIGQSQADWTRFFELYQTVIEKFAAFAGARREAEDVAQGVFLKLVEVFRDSTYDPRRGSFRAYLATMIRREVVNRWHKSNVRAADRHVSIDNDEHPVNLASANDPALLLDAKWRLARHAAAVEHVLTKTALAERSKAIYRAYVLEERPIGEVAAAFGVPNNAVSQTKTRIERMIAEHEALLGERLGVNPID